MQQLYTAAQTYTPPAFPDDFIVRDSAELSVPDVVDCRLELSLRGRRKDGKISSMGFRRCVVLAISRPQLRSRARVALAAARRTPGGRTWNVIAPCLKLDWEDISEWDTPKV